MSETSTGTKIISEAKDWLATPNALRDILIIVLAMVLSYWLSHFLAQAIIKIAQTIATRSDKESNDARVMKLRQTETYLSITVAVVRAGVVIAVGYIAWTIINPFSADKAMNSVAAIGAGTFFALIAGQTVGIVLRDLTAGAVMIAEGWYRIGDFIKIEPYGNVEGVVERFTLRSTRLRALNGEIILIHNQNITGVHATPRGVRTIAVDVFVRDKDRGSEAIKKIISAIPRGKTMLARPLHITKTEQWGEDRWRITVVGQTTPGREWLIEKFFVEALADIDEGQTGTDRLLVLPPMSRNADEAADKRFGRAVRVKQEK
ncbi:MAG: mechanosensitive ion channel domain-containing protein [Sphaerimonospora mesophila]